MIVTVNMRKRSKNLSNGLLWILSVYISLCVYFPYLSGRIPSIIPFTLVLFITFAVALLVKGRISKKDLTFILISVLWLAWFWLCLSSAGNAYVSYRNMIVSITITLLCAWFLVEVSTVCRCSLLTWIILVSIIVTILISLSYLKTNAYIVRILATGASLGDILGIGGYDFVYSVSFLCPCLLFLSRTVSWIKKIAFLVVTALVVFYTASCGLVTTSIIALAGIAIYLVIKISNQQLRRFIIGLIAFLFVFLIIFGESLMLNAMIFFNEMCDNDIINGKFMDIISVLQGGAEQYGTISGRTSRYAISWGTFKQSPVFGGFLFGLMNTSGGHSTILDYMAITGILGLLLYFIMLFMLYRKVSQRLTKQISRYILWEIFCIYSAVACLKGVSYASIVWTVFVIVPWLVQLADHALERKEGIPYEGYTN